jgi:hypothetical protein
MSFRTCRSRPTPAATSPPSSPPLSSAPAIAASRSARSPASRFGRHDLPGAPAPVGARGTPLAASLRGHFLGDADYEGLAVFTGRRFLSERSLPAGRGSSSIGLGPEQAAARLLDGADLDPAEATGAVLSPWPASAAT